MKFQVDFFMKMAKAFLTELPNYDEFLKRILRISQKNAGRMLWKLTEKFLKKLSKPAEYPGAHD